MTTRILARHTAPACDSPARYNIAHRIQPRCLHLRQRRPDPIAGIRFGRYRGFHRRPEKTDSVDDLAVFAGKIRMWQAASPLPSQARTMTRISRLPLVAQHSANLRIQNSRSRCITFCNDNVRRHRSPAQSISMLGAFEVAVEILVRTDHQQLERALI